MENKKNTPPEKRNLPPPGGMPSKRPPASIFIWLLVLVMIVTLFIYKFTPSANTKDLSQSEFEEYLKKGWILTAKVLPETDIQLMLAGHTHAMQFRLGGFSPSAWIYPEWGGLYTEEGRGLHVNVGLGSVMIPYRFGAWPEVTVITLRRK